MVECSGIWNKQDWKTANEKSGKRFAEALLSEWAQTLKIPVSHMSASRACSVKEAFNHQEQNEMPYGGESNSSSSYTSACSMGP